MGPVLLEAKFGVDDVPCVVEMAAVVGVVVVIVAWYASMPQPLEPASLSHVAHTGAVALLRGDIGGETKCVLLMEVREPVVVGGGDE